MKKYLVRVQTSGVIGYAKVIAEEPALAAAMGISIITKHKEHYIVPTMLIRHTESSVGPIIPLHYHINNIYAEVVSIQEA